MKEGARNLVALFSGCISTRTGGVFRNGEGDCEYDENESD